MVRIIITAIFIIITNVWMFTLGYSVGVHSLSTRILEENEKQNE